MSLEDTLLPSKEAPNRLLIGTQMLQSNQNSKYMSNNSNVYQTPHYPNHLNGGFNGQNGIQRTREVNSDKVRYIDVIDEIKMYDIIIIKCQVTFLESYSNNLNILLQTKEDDQYFLIDSLNLKRKEQLTIVSTLKQKLLDLEQSEVEEIGELDFERSLIIGELDSENEQLRKVSMK